MGLIIDLNEYFDEKVEILSGFTEGKRFRRIIELDRLDRITGLVVTIKIPETVYSFNESFFQGLFEDSLAYLGIDGFFARYRFDGVQHVVRSMNSYIYRVERYVKSREQAEQRKRAYRKMMTVPFFRRP